MNIFEMTRTGELNEIWFVLISFFIQGVAFAVLC